LLRCVLVCSSDAKLAVCRQFIDEDFAFFGKIIDGKKELPQRWKVCIDRLDKSVGELSGNYYAQRMFSGSAKQAAGAMIQYIEQAMSANIQTLSTLATRTSWGIVNSLTHSLTHSSLPIRATGWMDSTTRVGAEDKMSKLTDLVGYGAAPRSVSSPLRFVC